MRLFCTYLDGKHRISIDSGTDGVLLAEHEREEVALLNANAALLSFAQELKERTDALLDD